MKYYISAILLTTSLSAYAGLSSEDPSVAAARQRFSQAHVPSTSELNIGGSWRCMNYDAREGFYSSILNPGLTFTQFDGVYLTQGVGAVSDTYVPSAQGLVTTTGVQGREDLVNYITFRVDRDGYLIRESAVKVAGATSWTDVRSKMKLDPAVSVNFGYALNYSVCTTTLVPKKKKHFWDRN